ADGLPDEPVATVADRADVTEAHVRDPDVVRGIAVGAEAGQVVDGADQVGPLALAGVVENLDGNEAGMRGDADDPGSVVGGRDDARDVGPMAVTVLGRTGRDAVLAEG